MCAKKTEATNNTILIKNTFSSRSPKIIMKLQCKLVGDHCLFIKSKETSHPEHWIKFVAADTLTEGRTGISCDM